MVDFTAEEIRKLEQSQVYNYYKNIDWGSITVATVEADLDAIKSVNIETLPLIKFLIMILKSKTQESTNDTLTSLAANVLDIEEVLEELGIYTWGAIGGPFAYGVQTTTLITETDLTLNAGSIAATEIYDPTAGKKAYVLWVMISSNLAGAAGGQNYNVIISEEDGNALRTFNFNSLSQPVQVVVGQTTTTDAKKVYCQIAGGSAAEVCTVQICAGKY